MANFQRKMMMKMMVGRGKRVGCERSPRRRRKMKSKERGAGTRGTANRSSSCLLCRDPST